MKQITYCVTPICVIFVKRSLVFSKLLSYKVRNKITFNRLYITTLSIHTKHKTAAIYHCFVKCPICNVKESGKDTAARIQEPIHTRLHALFQDSPVSRNQIKEIN